MKRTFATVGESSNLKRKGFQPTSIERNSNYHQQYAQIYFCRLQALLPILRENSKSKWSSSPIVNRVLEVSESSGSRCTVIGTLFAELPLKPNVLQDLSDDLTLPVTLDKVDSYLSPTTPPIYYVEDDSGRLKLLFDEKSPHLNTEIFITGQCISFSGRILEDGRFLVEDYCLPGFAPLSPLPSTELSNSQQDSSPLQPSPPPPTPSSKKYALLVSGLEMGYCEDNYDFSIELLFDFISGNLCLPSTFPIKADLLNCCIFVGNNLSSSRRRIDETSQKKYGLDTAKYDINPLKELDDRLSLLSLSIPLVIMPGTSDPTNLSLPQSPLNKGLLPKTFKELWSPIKNICNPDSISIENVEMLLSSGESLNDSLKYCPPSTDPLEVAKTHLLSRHVAPSAPDTLFCFPFFERDPFVIERSPHLYVVGNQASYSASKWGSSSPNCILVPSFMKTRTVVLLDLDDLSSTSLKLG